MEKKKRSHVCLYGVLLLVLSLCTVNMAAQEIRYVLTKTIDKNGVENNNPNVVGYGKVIKLRFSGQRIIHEIPGISFPVVIQYQYHHSDGGNSVYYQVAKDVMTGREVINADGVVVVSPDRRLVNQLNYFQGQRQMTNVYKRDNGDRYDTMSQ